MDLFDFLSDEGNYKKLIKIGVYEVFKRISCSGEDAEDIVSESLENVLDYYQRKPEKLMDLESKNNEEMKNYIKKSLKNHILNIIIRNHKAKIKEMEFIEKMQYGGSEEIQKQSRHLNQLPDQFLSLSERVNAGLTINFTQSDCKNIKKDIYSFIEKKYKSGMWESKKEAISLYMKRIKEKKTISQVQMLIPDKNISSLNTQAHRIIKSYRNWLKKHHNHKFLL